MKAKEKSLDNTGLNYPPHNNYIPANAICLECGTAKENPITGYCINDHDDWLEEGDSFERLFEACKKFKLVNVMRLKIHITNSICINKKS